MKVVFDKVDKYGNGWQICEAITHHVYSIYEYHVLRDGVRVEGGVKINIIDAVKSATSIHNKIGNRHENLQAS